jgi:predicted ATPase
VAFAAPLVGRSADLSRLLDVLGGGAAERTVLVLGDAGIGKSRLLWEAVQQLTRVGATVLQGGCLPLTEALPLLPIVEALRGLARLEDGRLISGALAGQPGYVRQEIARLLPELGAGSGDLVSGPGEGWQRERLFTAVRELLAAANARRRIVLVVEDLHWADRTTLDLLRFLDGSAVPGPIPLAVSCRGDEPVTGSALLDWLAAARSAPSVAELILGPLGPEPATEQAAALLGQLPTPATLAALYRRTAGNPFFTEQLIAAGLPTVEEGGPSMAVTMPAGLAALLSARVRRASPPARQVLAALAVAGDRSTKQR